MKTKTLGRVLDTVYELDALGMVEALNLSWGRHGYSKVITLRVNPEDARRDSSKVEES